MSITKYSCDTGAAAHVNFQAKHGNTPTSSAKDCFGKSRDWRNPAPIRDGDRHRYSRCRCSRARGATCVECPRGTEARFCLAQISATTTRKQIGSCCPHYPRSGETCGRSVADGSRGGARCRSILHRECLRLLARTAGSTRQPGDENQSGPHPARAARCRRNYLAVELSILYPGDGIAVCTCDWKRSGAEALRTDFVERAAIGVVAPSGRGTRRCFPGRYWRGQRGYCAFELIDRQTNFYRKRANWQA